MHHVISELVLTHCQMCVNIVLSSSFMPIRTFFRKSKDGDIIDYLLTLEDVVSHAI